MRLDGSCHCGAVRFSLESPHPDRFSLCYCSICRKTSGGGDFAIDISGSYETLVIEGRENLRIYQAMVRYRGEAAPHRSPGRRHFCVRCGSQLWMWDPRWPELVDPLASAIDTPLPVAPERTHLLLESKAPWVPLRADPQDKLHQGFPDESIAEWHERLGLVDESQIRGAPGPSGQRACASAPRVDKIPLVALDRKLGRWVEAGLIASDQAQAIAAFERDRGRPTFLYAVAGLGGLAIFIGLVSIVAANWDAIPGRVKIGVDLALVAALGQIVVAFDRRGRALAREIAILVSYGAVLASIALIGQVYQLGGQLHSALSIWTLLTALVVAWGRSAILAFVWAMGLQATYWAWLARLAERPGIDAAWMVGAVVWAPLVLLLAGRSAWLTERRSAFARVFRAVGWAELVLAGSVGSAAFYTNTQSEKLHGLWLGMLVSAALAGVLAWRMNRSAGDRMARWLLAACLVLAYVPALISFGDLDVLAALCLILLWFLVALTAHRSGSAPLLNLATAVIGMRLLVVYFEVFGSLLSTGVGLVSGGLLTLGLVWLWLRKRRDFAEALAARGDER